MFPRLPVLDAVVSSAGQGGRSALEGVLLICVQHLLRTTGSLLEATIRLGAEPAKVFVVGKGYSTHPGTVGQLRRLGLGAVLDVKGSLPGHHAEAMHSAAQDLVRMAALSVRRERPRLVVLLDDGGVFAAGVPRELALAAPVVRVEQTTSGLWTSCPGVPVIEVGGGAAKRLLEPAMIARRVVDGLLRTSAEFRVARQVGVVGAGSIGMAVAELLVARGYEVPVFDIDRRRAKALGGGGVCNSVAEVVERSAFTLGCTGRDLGALIDLRDVTEDKVLASCSSSDIEWRSLLLRGEHPKRTLLREEVILRTQRGNRVRVLSGGHPVNFDGRADSVPPEQIQLTRGLLLGAVLQASAMARITPENRVMLDPELQRFVVRTWAATGAAAELNYPANTLRAFNNVKWLAKRSSGTYVAANGLHRMVDWRESPQAVA